MSSIEKPLSLDDAVFPAPAEPAPDVREFQDRKIKAGLAEADAGRFAPPEAVKAVIKKFIPNG